MALIACPECGRQVSSHAEQCPQCAYPIAGKSASRAGGDVGGKAVGAIGAWLVSPWIARAVAVVALSVVAIVYVLSR